MQNTSKYYQQLYQDLMRKELCNAYTSDSKISIVNFPTGSGKSYLTRQLHDILGLRKTDIETDDEIMLFQRVILCYPTKEQCLASFRAIQNLDDPDIHVLYLRSLEDQINTIKDLKTQKRDIYSRLIEDISNAYQACSESNMEKSNIEDIFQTLFVIMERNQKKRKENESRIVVIGRQPEEGVTDFKKLYRLLYNAMNQNPDLITSRIKEYFPDLQFDQSNIVICTHQKTFNSLLPFRSANVDSRIDLLPTKDDNDNHDNRTKEINEYELRTRNVWVIDEIEKFIESYNDRKMESAKKGAIDYNNFCEKVVVSAHSDKLLYYIEKVDLIIQKHKNRTDEKYKNLCKISAKMETAYQNFVDCVDKIAPKYNHYQVFFRLSEKRNNKDSLPVYTAYNADCYAKSNTLYCHVQKGKKATTIVMDEEKEDADFSLATWFKDSGQIIRSYFRYLRMAINGLQQAGVVDYKPQDREQIIEALLNELGYSSGTEEWQFTKTSIYPPIQHQHYSASEMNDWYSIGIYRYYIEKLNGNVDQFCRMTAVHIGRSAQAFLSDASEHFHTVYMLSATASLNSISGVDWAYLSEHGKVYATPIETTDKIMHYFYKERETEYKSTKVEVQAFDISEQEIEQIRQNQNHIKDEYFEKRTIPVLKEYMQTAINGVVRYKTEAKISDMPGMCFEAVLSRTYVKDIKNPLPIASSCLKIPEGLTVIFLQLGKDGVQVLNGDEVAFVREKQDVKVAQLCDVNVEDDRYIINLAMNTVAFLMTAYRSGERSYNTCIREKTDSKTEWSLAGMLVMQITNLVPSGYDDRLKINPGIKVKFKIERELDAFDLGMRQLRMNEIPLLDDVAHGEECISPKQLTRRDLFKLDAYASGIAKRSIGESTYGLTLDICGKTALYSPYKQSALSAYEQTFGRFRNEQRPPYVLLAIQTSIQEEHNFDNGEIDQPYPYEMHLLLTELEKQKQVDEEINALQIHNTAYNAKEKDQSRIEKQVENRIKIEIPRLKKAIYETQNLDEKEDALKRIKELIEDQENYKKASVDFTCFYPLQKPKKGKIKEYCYIQNIKNQDGKGQTEIREFSMVSTLRDRDKSVDTGCREDSKPVYDNNVRLTDIHNDDQAIFLPRDPKKEFGMGEQLMMLYRIDQNIFHKQFPHLEKRTLERIIRQNRFPYPITYEGWCTAKGEIGERVFYGLWEAARKHNYTNLLLIASHAFPQVYEDYDFLLTTEDKKKILGAINVKNVESKYQEEKKPEIRIEKGLRMKNLPGIVNNEHLKVAYLNVMPSISFKRQYPDSFFANGMESQQFEMFTKNVYGLSENEISKEVRETITILEEYFDAKQYINIESNESDD